jgi:hypothetical protein
MLTTRLERALQVEACSGTRRETTQIYLDADLALKEQALAKTNPVKGAPKRYQPDDELLAFLKQL